MPPTSVYNIALEERYRHGEIIFEEGNSGDWVYVVLSGEVEVSKTVEGKVFTLGTLKPGEVFGELALIGAVRRTATTRARGETRVGIVDRSLLDKEFNKLSADFRGILLALVARFIKVMDDTREFFTRQTTRVERVLALTFQSRQQFLAAKHGYSYASAVGRSNKFVAEIHIRILSFYGENFDTQRIIHANR